MLWANDEWLMLDKVVSGHYLASVRTRTEGGSGRMSAEQRRASVLAAAVVEFAHGGLTGTSTESIAARAGISQPYLFRLYPTKKALFLAVIEDTFRRTATHFERAVGELTGEAALDAMKESYQELLADPTYLLNQLQAYSGCYDPDVQVATRTGFHRLWDDVVRITGLPTDEIRLFFAYGMLFNIIAAMDLAVLDEQWAQMICMVAPPGSTAASALRPDAPSPDLPGPDLPGPGALEPHPT
ncbi:transcriptional regulator, TetR family [Frankia torreyi]|uniref:Transcriptional regulator, TetR family n=2 Tax=Frankiaceae TaxID=74712 RepID=A0A0D8B8Z2_9ACTN|nr:MULTISPECIES: TetR/AcrR family transcriptional regulator [Frankia]KJE20723.1 transcriptional regulator, TetR family [Frankia torreyi]